MKKIRYLWVFIIGALALVLLMTLAGNFSQTALAASSCVGVEACVGATGPIGENACNGYRACYQSNGPRGNGACNGEMACSQSKGAINVDSCNGINACALSTGYTGILSCNGNTACYESTGRIGDNQDNNACPSYYILIGGACIPGATPEAP